MFYLIVDYDIRKLIDRGNKAFWLQQLIVVREPEGYAETHWAFLVDLDWTECAELNRMMSFLDSHYDAEIVEMEEEDYYWYEQEIDLYKGNDEIDNFFLEQFGVTNA